VEILLASTNPGKLEELVALFVDVPGYTFKLGPPLDIEETGQTFAENAAIKALTTMKATGQACLADDSGLTVEAMDGRPGVYSARYAPTNEARIAKLLAEMDQIPASKRQAAFECAMALALPDGTLIAVEGRCEGVITRSPRGAGGFGYDPIFEVPTLGQTFGEIDAEAKNRLSHRALATARLKAALAGTL
jgi:XTP/dITP diphosphohydrolase